MQNHICIALKRTRECCRVQGYSKYAFQPYPRQHLMHNFRYQNDNPTPYCSRTVATFRQQGITKMVQPANSSDLIPIQYLWDDWGFESGGWKTSDWVGDLWETLLDNDLSLQNASNTQWPACPWCLTTFIRIRKGNNQYWINQVWHILHSRPHVKKLASMSDFERVSHDENGP